MAKYTKQEIESLTSIPGQNYAAVREEFTRAQNKEARDAVRQDPDRLRFHLMPPVGWLNDPNGLSEFNGTYHIFYQFTPARPDGQDHRGWGHYTTKDFIHYQEQEDPLVPDTVADGKGSYSGSAFIHDGKMHLFYTGNNKVPGDYDYINDGRIHYVMHTESDDGLNFTEKEVLMKNSDYPEYLSCHVRDPKILEQDGKFYMVLGARTKDSIGEAEIFESDNLHDWNHVSAIKTEEPFGYMWECPDLFDVDDQRILICCPQGNETQGYKFENIYDNGYFKLGKDLEHDQKAGVFTELDHGFDFYAPQSFEDEKGRRILIGWMGMPDADYTNPTEQKGWQHALTMPRELHFKDDTLYQYPIEEMLSLRQESLSAELEPGKILELPSKTMELQLKPGTENWTLSLGTDCKLSLKDGLFTLAFGASGSGRTARHVQCGTIETLSIFADTSSLEIFINNGQYALTTRYYDPAKMLSLCADAPMQLDAWTLSSFEIEEKLDKQM